MNMHTHAHTQTHMRVRNRDAGCLQTTVGRETRRLMKDREVVTAVTEVTTGQEGWREVELAGLRSCDKLGGSS